ncbi:ABC transporter permease, partial [Bacillus safensis]
IMGTTVFYSIILITLLFIVDVAYRLLDPRIQLHQKGGKA